MEESNGSEKAITRLSTSMFPVCIKLRMLLSCYGTANAINIRSRFMNIHCGISVDKLIRDGFRIDWDVPTLSASIMIPGWFFFLWVDRFRIMHGIFRLSRLWTRIRFHTSRYDLNKITIAWEFFFVLCDGRPNCSTIDYERDEWNANRTMIEDLKA